MKLGFEEIRRITFGAVAAEDTGSGIVFSKCTKKQISAWYAMHKDLGQRAETTTGIRLDFHTDSSAFSFRIVRGGKFDVLINGFLSYHVKQSEGSNVFSCALPEGENRVTLIFPSHSVGIIDDVTLDDGASMMPHKFDTRILFYGDSITQGWETEFDSLSYAWRTALHYNADCVINGIGGAVFYPEAADEIPFMPDTVITALGTNDFGKYRTLDDLKNAAEGTFKALAALYPHSRLVALTPIWRADDDKEKAMGSFSACCEVVARSAAGYGFEVIDGYKLVPHFTYVYADEKIHPNDLGMGLYADNLIKALDAGK